MSALSGVLPQMETCCFGSPLSNEGGEQVQPKIDKNISLALKHLRSILDILLVIAPIEEQRQRDRLENATDEELQEESLRNLIQVLGNICEQDPVRREIIREALGL